MVFYTDLDYTINIIRQSIGKVCMHEFDWLMLFFAGCGSSHILGQEIFFTLLKHIVGNLNQHHRFINWNSCSSISTLFQNCLHYCVSKGSNCSFIMKMKKKANLWGVFHPSEQPKTIHRRLDTKSIAPFRSVFIQYSVHRARQAGSACGIKHAPGHQICSMYCIQQGQSRGKKERQR